MSITKAEILTFVNSVLNRTESDVTQDILLVLDELSDAHVLKSSDLTLTLTSTDTYLVYPATALSDAQAIISIALTDAAGDRKWLLAHYPGGWREYQRGMSSFTRATPEYYVCMDRKAYLYPPPDADYTVELHFWARHAADADAITFGDEWKRAIWFGTAYEVACRRKMPDAIAIWSQRYAIEKQKQQHLHADHVSIVE